MDLSDVLIEQGRVAKMQIEENRNGMGWKTTIDIPIPESFITTNFQDFIRNDLANRDESPYVLHVTHDNRDIEFGAYNEDGFMTDSDLDLSRFDIAGQEAVYFGPYFLLHETSKIEKVILGEDLPKFREELDTSTARRKEIL